jgi:hypothetical protein
MDLESFFWGCALGCFASSSLIVIVLRWAWRRKEILTELIKEIYHIDLLPLVCRVEGLLSLAIMEWRMSSPFAIVYVEKALIEIKELKQNIMEAVKRYEPYQ